MPEDYPVPSQVFPGSPAYLDEANRALGQVIERGDPAFQRQETDRIIDLESQRLRQPGQGFGVLTSFNPETGQRQTFSVAHPAPTVNFDDPAYQKSLYEWEQEVRRKAEAARAEQAIQAGIRHIYQQRYDADIKRGVPEQQAFSRMMLGVAMHTPKSDPVKMYDAFRTRPAPTAQMMKFGTNEVPVIINTDSRGGQRATPVPASVLPQVQGEIVIKYDPVSKRHFQLRNNQWYPVTSEEAKRLTPLEKITTAIETKAMKEAAEVLRKESKKQPGFFGGGGPNAKKVEQATKDYQSASNAIYQASQPAGAAPKATGELQVGEVRRGYRFKGGNPADKSNWEKVE
jgi:hypothetical protein